MLRLWLPPVLLLTCFSLSASNPEYWTADGWEVEEVARMSIRDHVSPFDSPHMETFSCVIDISGSPEPTWSVALAGDRELVYITEQGATEYFVDDCCFPILPELSDEYVLIAPQLEGRYLARLSLADGEITTIETDHPRTDIENWSPGFRCLMGKDGSVYFLSYDGYIGGYSSLTGNVGQEITDGARRFRIGSHSVAEDGSIYAVLVGRYFEDGGDDAVIGYSLEEGILWETRLHNTPPYGWLSPMDVSSDGGRIAVDRKNGGLLILDGRTGQIEENCLEESAVRTLSLSPNGRYAAVGYADQAWDEYLACLDVELHEILSRVAYSEYDLERHFAIQHVAADGTYLGEDRARTTGTSSRFYVINRFGECLWRTTRIRSSIKIVNSPYSNSNSETAFCKTDSGYLLVYVDIESGDVVILNLNNR